MAFPLTSDQQAAADHRGSGLLVAAAAGSGKTRVLVERLLNRVTQEGEDITGFLVITYTKAAAAELRGRIAQEISVRLGEDPTNRHLRRQATQVYCAQISTIHAFCSVLLRENGHLIDLDPDFRLMDEGEGDALKVRVLGDVMDDQYEHMTPAFQTLVDTLSAGRDDSRLEQIVLDIFGRIQSHPRPMDWLQQQRTQWTLEVDGVEDTPWGQLVMDHAHRQVVDCCGELQRAIDLCQGDKKLAENYVPSMAQSLLEVERLVAALEGSWDETVRCLPITFPRVGTKRGVEDQYAQSAVKGIRTRCKGQLEQVAGLFDGDSETQMEDLHQCSAPMLGLMDLVEIFSQRYAQEKRRRSVLDFSDLEHFAVQLLVEESGQPTPLAQRWSERYCEVMVDEYQDTNEVQNAIFHAVSQEGRRLFMVGDVKQSIYRFNLADPTIFLDKLNRFPKREAAAEGDSCTVVLGQNFRSRPQVLQGCNELFQSLMTQQFGEMDYTADHYLYPGASYPQGAEYNVELTALDMSFMGAEEKEEKNLYEARWVAGRIRQLLDDKFQVTQGEGSRDLEPSDVMVLLRSPTGVMHHYIRALGEAAIPWAASGGGDFFAHTEIRVALSLLRVVDNVRQDVPLIALLRSPMFDFSGDKLSAIRSGCKGDFYTALCHCAQGGDEDCQQVVQMLEELRFGGADMTCSQLIWHIYEQSNLLGLFGAMEGGEGRRDHLLTLHALATALESSGCRTLFDFLLRLDKLRETGGRVNAPAPQGEGVTIMSIHRSKGLEKPVVIVAGLSKRFNKNDLQRPVLFHPQVGVAPRGLDVERMVEYPTVARRAIAQVLDRELLGEELRLLYVAMTRAREKLILCIPLVTGSKTLERLGEATSVPPTPAILAAQQSMGGWILLHAMTRPEGGALRMGGNVPLREDSPYPWDIFYEDGERLIKPMVAVSSQQMAVEKEALELPDYSWSYPYETGVDIPSKVTATQLKKERQTNRPEAPLEIPTFVSERRGLTPAQRGTAIHTAIQYLDLDTPIHGAEMAIREMVEGGFLTQAQGAVVSPQLVADFLQSTVAQQMRTAKRVEREFPFSILLPASEYDPQAPEGETVMLQGVVDCWFENEEGITIVDFKSDRVTQATLMERSEGYRLQLVAYRRAMEEILGKKVGRCVLWFLTLGQAVELPMDDGEKIIK